MTKLKKGDTYCTMWTNNLAGPFVYDGEKNIIKSSVIPAAEGTIMYAQAGIDFLLNLHTLTEGEFAGTLDVAFPDLFSDETIDDAVALHPNSGFALAAVRKLAPRIRELIGEGK